MEKLKPCPFCGSDIISYPKRENWIQELTNDIYPYMRYCVKCLNCQAKIERSDYADVLEAWNRRANENDE